MSVFALGAALSEMEHVVRDYDATRVVLWWIFCSSSSRSSPKKTSIVGPMNGREFVGKVESAKLSELANMRILGVDFSCHRDWNPHKVSPRLDMFVPLLAYLEKPMRYAPVPVVNSIMPPPLPDSSHSHSDTPTDSTASPMESSESESFDDSEFDSASTELFDLLDSGSTPEFKSDVKSDVKSDIKSEVESHNEIYVIKKDETVTPRLLPSDLCKDIFGCDSIGPLDVDFFML
jgi:hypothetical protein